MADLFGRYRLDDRLGQGGMGVVYRAWDTVLERVVAVKMMIGEGHTDPAARERFFREARSAAQLTHKNIVTVYDLGEEQGQPYLAMEFLDGEDLQRRLARPEKASVWRKVTIALEICHGMEFAHAHGVIHRDLKPGNIFVTAAGGVKVLDFGLARFVSSQLTQSNMLLGTINYMAPEQVRGDRADQQSDVFSIGVVLYELFGGRRAFEGDSAASTLYKILQEYPEPLWKIDSGLPRELTTIVDRALAKPRDERYPDVASLRRDLEMLQSPSPHPGPATPWPSTAVIPPAPGSGVPLIPAAPQPPGSAPLATSAQPAAVASPSTPASSGVSPTAPAPESALTAPKGPSPNTSRGFWVGTAFGALAIAFAVVWMANRRAEPVASAPAPPPSRSQPAPAAPPAAPAVPATVSAAADVHPRTPPAETPAADRRGVPKRSAASAAPPAARSVMRGETPTPATETPSAPSPSAAATAVRPAITTGAAPPVPPASAPVPQPAPSAPPVAISQPVAPPPAIAPPAAPPPPVEPPLSAERADDLLRRYKAALEGRSLDQLKRIWPSLGGAGETAIRREFQQASRITVDISERQITAAASTGRITFVRGYTLVTVDGQRLQSTSQAAMDVRRAGDGWLIDSIRFTPR